MMHAIHGAASKPGHAKIRRALIKEASPARTADAGPTTAAVVATAVRA